jgi:hypothetical protein
MARRVSEAARESASLTCLVLFLLKGSSKVTP